MHLVAVTDGLNLLREVGKASGRSENKAGNCWTNRSDCSVGCFNVVVIKYRKELGGEPWPAWLGPGNLTSDQKIKDRHADTGTEKLGSGGLCSP